jgi:hypothetical protein
LPLAVSITIAGCRLLFALPKATSVQTLCAAVPTCSLDVLGRAVVVGTCHRMALLLELLAAVLAGSAACISTALPFCGAGADELVSKGSQTAPNVLKKRLLRCGCGSPIRKDMSSYLNRRRVGVAFLLISVLELGAHIPSSDEDLRRWFMLFAEAVWGQESLDICLHGAAKTLETFTIACLKCKA